ncbi:MAG TPA: AAA family ATPase [Sulfurovum sp.]|nr:AAA family ATPase [Sulfurovum sp.]
MIEITSLNDILALKEDYDIEFKKALGKNGRGKLPDDFFETYSAMANTYGGRVFLGIKEENKEIALSGIKEPEPIKKELFDTLNNKNKISNNILRDEHIEILKFGNDYVIEINIPQATRQQKPIFKGQNPFQGTYIRQYEGDYRCSEEYVKRMLAEQIEDSRDNKVLKNYDFDDIDMSSFYAYRNIFKSHKPDHPFNEQNDLEFLKSIGGYKKDRETGDVGVTLAGLLMFGKSSSIEEVLPYYLLDYQERPKAKTELRWIDRVTIDGTWSGNIFDFYRIVIKKLFEDLKVPFRLDMDKRQDDTLIHQAIREALINTIVHADYSQRSSVLIVKRPDMFGFRNPGLMRIPIESAVKGGDSDCRNRTLHKMFMLIGYGERAGSGIPKIYSGWNSQDWTKPLLYEKREPEQTLLELRMLNLLNDEIIEELKELYRDNLERLSKDELTILTTAYIEEGTNHKRLLELLDLHPSDISHILRKLVDEDFLHSDGVGRGTIYQAGGLSDLARGVKDLAGGLTKSAEGLSVFYNASDIPEAIHQNIIHIVEQIVDKQRVKKETMQTIILNICNYGYFSPELLSLLLDKSKEWIKEHTSELVKTNKLKKLYEIPNHPKQAYTQANNNL